MILSQVEDAGDFTASLMDVVTSGTVILALSSSGEGVVEEETVFAILAVRGVLDASTTAGGDRVEVHFDPDLTGARDIVRSLEGCGVSATVVNPAADQAQDKQQARARAHARRLFVISLVITLPIFLLAMVLPHIHDDVKKALHTRVVNALTVQLLVLCILTTPVQFVVGKCFYVGAYKALRLGHANMDVLIAMGTTAAYVYSVGSMIFSIADEEFEGDNYFETSAMLITFVFMGKYIELVARGKTSQALLKLMDLQPSTAVIVHPTEEGVGDGPPDADEVREETIPVELLQRGDILKVLPGSEVPADGVVVFGVSSVDESMITGESRPVTKGVDDAVIGGTVNLTGLMHVRATSVGSDSMLSQIVQLVQNAQMTRPPIQAMADRISARFVPAVVALASLAFVVWLIVGYTVLPDDWLPPRTSRFLFALLFFITTLVIACPCALGLATPTAVMVGTGLGAKHGVLIKSGEALETAHKIDSIIFDKTGTLTHGQPRVTDLYAVDGADEEEVLVVAASAESGSEHPLGRAICEHASSIPAVRSRLSPCADFEAVPGRGLRCTVAGVPVLIGNRAWMKAHTDGVPPTMEEVLVALEECGKTAVLVAHGGHVIGVIGIADALRPEAAAVVAKLAECNVEVWMVTGDNTRTAMSIAASAGITHVFAEVLPAEKAKKVQELQQQGKTVAMVGDGINDAPALVQADVGVAIGAGTDIAIEAADMVLMRSDLRDVFTGIDISRRTFARIKLNFFYAFGYNVCALPIACGMFYPLMRAMMPPWVAGLAMAMSSVTVVCSSALLKRYRKPIFEDPMLEKATVLLPSVMECDV